MRKVLALFISLILLTFPAYAQQSKNCAPRDDLIEGLKRKYKELPVAVAITQKGFLIEVFTSYQGKTFSILMTSPKQTVRGQPKSCLVVAGEDWTFNPYDQQIPGVDM